MRWPASQPHSRPRRSNRQAEGYIFTDVKINPATSVKDQSRSGTCWAYSALGFVESEIMRAGGEEVALSPMWVVRNIYFEKAVRSTSVCTAP